MVGVFSVPVVHDAGDDDGVVLPRRGVAFEVDEVEHGAGGIFAQVGENLEGVRRGFGAGGNLDLRELVEITDDSTEVGGVFDFLVGGEFEAREVREFVDVDVGHGGNEV